MQLKEVKFGHSYQHRTLGQCAIVSCHPHDGAALIVAYWDHENDEEKFVLAVPEDLLYILPNEPVMRTEGACMVTQADAQVISDLIEVARAAWVALEGAESPTYGVLISTQNAFKLADMLTVLDLLPDREHCLSPGYMKSAYALEPILSLLPNVKYPPKQRFDLEGKPFGMGGAPFRYLGSVAPRIDGEPTLTPELVGDDVRKMLLEVAEKLGADMARDIIDRKGGSASKMEHILPISYQAVVDECRRVLQEYAAQAKGGV